MFGEFLGTWSRRNRARGDRNAAGPYKSVADAYCLCARTRGELLAPARNCCQYPLSTRRCAMKNSP